uniref:Uncharacterized protein n=1 Tax=Arundo donax TaxID=35708 RepID=A0A0A8Z8V0_ARUDO
MSCSWKSLVP